MISFDAVEIRSFERIVGDNPSTTAGPAVSLAWEHHDSCRLDFEEYEASRPPRRKQGEFQMPPSVRRELLLDTAAASAEEIRRAEKDIRRIQHQRRATVALQEWEGIQIVCESLGRKLKRVVKGNKDRREEEELWKKSRSYNVEKSILVKKSGVEEATSEETDVTEHFQ